MESYNFNETGLTDVTLPYAVYNVSDNDTYDTLFSILPEFNESIYSVDSFSHSGSPFTMARVVSASVVVVVVIIAIVFGNALVCVAIATDRTLKSTQNWFIASLAVADLLIGLIIIPFSLANELMGYWYFGFVWCELWKAIDVLLCTASINSLCLISLDRYWSITRALHYSRQRTPKRAAVMIAMVWILSAVVCVPPLIGWRQGRSKTKDGHPGCFLSDEIGYVLYSSFGSFFIPCIVMVFVYARVYWAALSRARKNVKSTPCPVSKNGKNYPPSSTVTTTAFVDKNPETTMPADGEGSSILSEGDDSVYTQYNPQTDKFERKAAQMKSKISQICEENQQLYELPESAEANQIGLVAEKQVRTSFAPRFLTETATDTSLDGLGSDVYDGDIKSGEVHNLLNVESDSAVQTDTPLVSRTRAANQNAIVVLTDGEDATQPGIPLTHLKQYVTRKVSRDKSHKDIVANASQREHDRAKRKIAKARERRATIVVGIVMIAFVACWLPFFTAYLTAAVCQAGFHRHCIYEFAFTFFFWLGYCNSAFNPIIYTIFNRDFRQAFQKILFARSRRNI